MKWHKLTIPRSEIHLSTVLRSGQAFRWRNIDGIWSCALNNQIILLKEIEDANDNSDNQTIEYSGVKPTNQSDIGGKDLSNFIKSYFNLEVSTYELHSHWSNVDMSFPGSKSLKAEFKIEGLNTPPPSRATPDPVKLETNNTGSGSSCVHGVRILSQDPWETLISFIISSNNNIKRISQLCEVLAIRYGEFVGEYNGIPYYFFPKPKDFFSFNSKFNNSVEVSTEQLAKLESELRDLGFGYRAKYITKTVHAMISNPELFEKLYCGYDKDDDKRGWVTDNECVEFLRQFDGVGPKVADCVALMGCRRHDLVPVDTHVWNILRSRYRDDFNKWIDLIDMDNLDEFDMKISKSNIKKSLSNKAVDVKIYPYVKRFFKDFWGLKAGWAQAVVFAGIVKLDNGINNIEDVEKLIEKVKVCKGMKEETVTDKPLKKRRKIK